MNNEFIDESTLARKRFIANPLDTEEKKALEICRKDLGEVTAAYLDKNFPIVDKNSIIPDFRVTDETLVKVAKDPENLIRHISNEPNKLIYFCVRYELRDFVASSHTPKRQFINNSLDLYLKLHRRLPKCSKTGITLIPPDKVRAETTIFQFIPFLIGSQKISDTVLKIKEDILSLSENKNMSVVFDGINKEYGINSGLCVKLIKNSATLPVNEFTLIYLATLFKKPFIHKMSGQKKGKFKKGSDESLRYFSPYQGLMTEFIASFKPPTILPERIYLSETYHLFIRLA